MIKGKIVAINKLRILKNHNQDAFKKPYLDLLTKQDLNIEEDHFIGYNKVQLIILKPVQCQIANTFGITELLRNKKTKLEQWNFKNVYIN